MCAEPTRPTFPRRRPAQRAGGLRLAIGSIALFWAALPAAAQRVDNSVAVFAALDKVTAKISRFEVPLNQTYSFGSLKVTPRACYTRQPTEPPKTTSFVEIDETLLDGKETRIFTGWMFADSPGLNALEHPVFDVWLAACSFPRNVAQQRPAQQGNTPSGQGGAAATQQQQPAGEETTRRRRPPR